MRQLGRHVRAIDVQIDELNDRLTPLVSDRAPELLALHGVGVDVAGNLLVALGQRGTDPVRGGLRSALRGCADSSVIGKDFSAPPLSWR